MADEASAAAAAPPKEEKDSKKRARDDDDAAADDEVPEMPEKWAKKDVGRAMLWYYRDKAGKRQGPFYPGQMRQWYVSGFFPASQLVAPSFKGEIPREYARLDAFYTNATEREAAFVAQEGVALWPTARAAPDAPGDDERNDAGGEDRRPQWLEDSIRRQRAGIKRKMIYGPVERENYN